LPHPLEDEIERGWREGERVKENTANASFLEHGEARTNVEQIQIVL